MAVALGFARAPRWVGTLVDEVLTAYVTAPVDRPRELALFVQVTQGWERMGTPPRVVRWQPVPTTAVRTRPGAADLPDAAALARLLDLDQGELAWFADVRALERTVDEPSRHYRWHAVERRGGLRLLAAPKPRLKEPSGGCCGTCSLRSRCTTRPTAACPAGRCGRRPRRTPAVPSSAAGPPAPAAGRPHLTGAGQPRLLPPRPPLAGLAATVGACYTRYVDDLTFSGDRRSRGDRFAELVTEVAAEEGFRVNPAKTRVIGAGSRQWVLGAAVNARPALPRPERDAMRALLHNCARHGWATRTRGHDPATFREHVLGRVAWATSLDPVFGARLHTLAAPIDWS